MSEWKGSVSLLFPLVAFVFIVCWFSFRLSLLVVFRLVFDDFSWCFLNGDALSVFNVCSCFISRTVSVCVFGFQFRCIFIVISVIPKWYLWSLVWHTKIAVLRAIYHRISGGGSVFRATMPDKNVQTVEQQFLPNAHFLPSDLCMCVDVLLNRSLNSWTKEPKNEKRSACK